MKIHFIASSLKGGGAERVLTLLANEFENRNNYVEVIAMNDGISYPLNPSIKNIRLFSGFKFNHTLRSFLNLLGYYRKKSNRPDVAIAFMPRMSLISIIVCRIYKIKIVGCEHNNHLRKTNWWIRFTWNYIYRYADKITVLTEFDREFFEKKRVDVEVMPNPCTFPLGSKTTKKDPVILAVGGLDRIYHKGFDNLLELIAPVLKENTPWKLKIAGGGEKGLKVLQRIANANDIENKVEFLGFVSDVQALMNNSEIFILPSRYEGLPMVLLEAMSQRMACIAYDCKTGPSEIITHGYNGLLIADQDKISMKEGLKELINNEELRKKLQNNAEKGLDKFSMDSIMKKWHDLFHELEIVK